MLALLGSSEAIIDLAVPVDDERDHIRGPADAPVTVVEYGDFECPYCGQAESVMRELLADHGDVRYVWRHLPLNDVHPNAQLAAEAAEAAADQGAFWDMHDLLLANQDDLRLRRLLAYADQLGLDVDRFARAPPPPRRRGRIAEDVDSADMSGVSGTPTFFINGRRHNGAYDLATLSEAQGGAGARRWSALRRRPKLDPADHRDQGGDDRDGGAEPRGRRGDADVACCCRPALIAGIEIEA